MDVRLYICLLLYGACSFLIAFAFVEQYNLLYIFKIWSEFQQLSA